MKHFIFLILAFVSLVAPAQDTSSDTIIAPELKEQELQEIVVEAPKVIHLRVLAEYFLRLSDDTGSR